ncbi:MAG: AAA family ATPase [Actinobacteria bacterium]|jgi:ATP-dependent Lon protease|nr:AAA family ATPase [Actinomycetota bacterium]
MVQAPNEKVKDLSWQLELMVSIHPEIVQSTLTELEIPVGMGGNPSRDAKTILEYFIGSAFSGLTKFLTRLCDVLSADKPDPIIAGIIKSWLSLLSSFCDEELYSIAFDAYDLYNDLSQNEIFATNASGERERHIELFSPRALYKCGLSRGTQNPERDEYARRILEKLTISGPYRRFSFEPDVLQKLDQLKEKTANFTHVIDYVMDAVSVSIHYHKPIKITPVILVGSPGIGKSYFTNQLSQCLGVPLRKVAMDNLQIGAGLSGSSYVYSNTETGAVFKVLTEEDHISPLIILDEIDKADGNFAHGDPLSPLHNLLEPISAKTFEDASFALTIDASRIIWIATANSIDKIPPAIQSRFEIFEISSQSPDAQAAILGSICEELANEYPEIEFGKDLLGILAQRTPREQRQMLQRALSRAIRIGESKVTAKHLEQAEPGSYLSSSMRRFGFRGNPG